MKFKTSLIIAGLCGIACSKKKEETTTPQSSTAANPVQDLATLPDATTLTQSASTALVAQLAADNSYALGEADAVNGTPPFVKDIAKTNIEEYFTGTIATIVTAIQTAKAAQDWTTVKTQVDSFRAAETKCRIVEDTARQISNLSDNTASMCYMAKVGLKDTGVVQYVSGTTFEDGEFFKPAADGSDTIRSITMSSGQSKVFKIFGSSSIANGYKIAFASCSSGTASDYTVIEVDNTLGTFSLSNRGSRTSGGGPGLATSTNLFDFSVTASLIYDAETSAYSFDTSKDRVVSAKHQSTGNGSNTFNGEMLVSEDTILSKLFMNHSFSGTDQNGASTSMSFLSKGINSARFSGTDMQDIIFFEGAGYQYSKGSSSGVGSTRTFESESTIGLEFNTDKSPKYDSVTSGTYYDQVSEMVADIATISPFDAGAEPSAPSSDMTAATELCTATPTTVARINMGSTGMKAITAACDGKRKGFGSSMCEGFREHQGTIMSIMNSRRDATGRSGKGE